MGSRRELVLVGGGHAHVQVLRRWMMRPLPDVRLTLVVDRPEAVYSGMVPGFVAGDYTAGEIEIDVVPLARRARAAVVLAPALSIDPVRRRIEVAGRPSLGYDVASLDFGAGVRGTDLPGVREHALATRPIRTLVDRLAAALGAFGGAKGAGRPRLAVVGAGVAGMELAFTLAARLEADGTQSELTVYTDTDEPVPGYSPGAARRVARLAAERGIRLHTGRPVTGVEPGRLWLGEERAAADLVVWAAGAAPADRPDASRLPRDAQGFVRVDRTLEVQGHEGLFAAGDCASLDAFPSLPKAGVYAVRQGSCLDANLRARLTGRGLRDYRPQRDFLSLLNLGNRSALASKWGLHAAGPWVWRWKDRIDRRFMRRFQVLEEDGEKSSDFPDPESMGMEPMECGGCAAKLAASSLERALGRLEAPRADPSVLLGLDRPDDAAAWTTMRGDVVLATIDAFRAFADDPWLVGRVAAVNAVSDVLAKGGTPRHALALVGLPELAESAAEELLYQTLAGVRAALDPEGVSLVGGHTTQGPELYVGVSITGELPSDTGALPLAGLRPGDALLLTKPLGTGVLLAADMQGLARGAWVQSAYAGMLRSNSAAAQAARALDASACTDVSGFGLAGHLAEMLRAGGVTARLDRDALPALPGSLELLRRGLRSTFHHQNSGGSFGVRARPGNSGEGRVELLFDPQTSGGLLFGVAEERAREALQRLKEDGDADAAIIGQVRPAGPEEPLIDVV